MAFDKLKQGKKLLQLRSQAKKMQEQLEKIEHSEEDDDNRVKVNGAQNVVYLEIDGEERQDIVDLINKAMKEVQKKSAQEMAQMQGGLSGLLDNM